MLTQQGCHERTARLRHWCAQHHVDLAIISDPKNVYYYSGFWVPKYGWLLPRVELWACFCPAGDTVLLCSESLKECAERATASEVRTYVDYDIARTTETYLEDALAPLEQTLRSGRAKVRTVAIEKRYAPVAILDMLQRLYGRSEIVDISDVILQMRRRKDRDEVDLLRRAADLTGICYESAIKEIAPGKTEVDIYAAVSSAYAHRVGGYVTFAGDFVSGERTLRFGGPPTQRVLAKGDTMILDLWIQPEGYWADNARSFAVGGEPSPEQIRIYDLVIQALEQASVLLRPGTKAKDVYQRMRQVFSDAGVDSCFPLHGGHGVGLSPHEAPLIIPGSDDVLEEGMVCALEPGLYVPETGGVRCEDMFVIRADGPERLTIFERKLEWG